MDISVNIHHFKLKLSVCNHNILPEGSVSQHFDLGLNYCAPGTAYIEDICFIMGITVYEIYIFLVIYLVFSPRGIMFPSCI